jgi:hypothetical protein
LPVESNISNNYTTDNWGYFFMATIKKFVLENFRGIEKTEITLSGRVNTPIVTLVGLNESGKTTILEALSHFATGDSIVAKIFEGTRASTQALSLIPIHKKANFTGVIKISGEVILDEDDIAEFSRTAIYHPLLAEYLDIFNL